MVDRLLTSNLDLRLVWDIVNPNEGISLQSDDGDIQPEYTFATGTGIGQYDTPWYGEIVATGNSTYELDLQNLPLSVLGMDVSRSFDNIKSISIENTTESSILTLGSDGISNSVDFFGIESQIGASGITEITSLRGFDIDSTHKIVGIRNDTGIDSRCKVLILGVTNVS